MTLLTDASGSALSAKGIISEHGHSGSQSELVGGPATTGLGLKNGGTRTMLTEKTVATTSYTGAATSIFSALTLTDIGIIVGIITAVLTFAFNVWFQYQRHKREKEEHELRVQKVLKDNDEREV